MSEDTKPQLPEAPPPLQGHNPPTKLYRFVSAAAGFSWAGFLAFVITVVFILAKFEHLPLLESGPVAGLILWGVFRKINVYFARGAIVFGIVSFLVVGTCFTFVASILR